jgi:hypothetical protein
MDSLLSVCHRVKFAFNHFRLIVGFALSVKCSSAQVTKQLFQLQPPHDASTTKVGMLKHICRGELGLVFCDILSQLAMYKNYTCAHAARATLLVLQPSSSSSPAPPAASSSSSRL